MLATKIIVGLVGLLIWRLAVAVYQLTFHPLARYPGPVLWAITAWSTFPLYCRGRWHIEVHEAHEKYGDVVRIGPNHLSFRSTRGVHDIYGDRKANLVKGGGFAEVSLHATASSTTPSTHSVSNREIHAKKRRLLTHAFSDSALKDQETYIIQTVRKWIDAIADLRHKPVKTKDWSQPKDLSLWSSNLTLDALGELCFGKSFAAIENGGHWTSELLMGSTILQSCIGAMPGRSLLYPLLRQNWLMLKIGLRSARQKVQYRAHMLPLLQARFKLEEDTRDKTELQRKDFMHYLIRAVDPTTGEKYSPSDLVGEAGLLVAAGTDTTSTALAAEFFYLTRYPDVLKKLQDEVRGAFDDIEEIKLGPKLSSLVYLRAVVDETLRMSSPVPDLLLRRVLQGGATIDGHHVPEGVIVGSTAYAVHHSENYFPRSFEFLPERWILGSEGLGFPVTATSLDLAKQAYIPFSLGTRGCVGKNMAMLELLVATARTVWLLDVKIVDGPQARIGEGGHTTEKGRGRVNEYQIKNYFLAERHGPFVQFKVRDGVTV